jgi:cell division protein FtsQ
MCRTMSESKNKVENSFVELGHEPKISPTPAVSEYAEKFAQDTSAQQSRGIEHEKNADGLEENGEKEWTETAQKNVPTRSSLLALMGVVGALLTVGILASWWLQHVSLSEFIITGNRWVRADVIAERINFMLGRAMQEVHLAEIEDTLCSTVWIKKAIATKEFPSTIRIQVVERRFVAFTSIAGRLKVVGDDGVLVDAEPEFLGKVRLPWLSGVETVRRNRQGLWALDSAEVAQALQLLAALQQRETSQAMLSEVQVSAKQVVAFSTGANTRFIFGNDGYYERKLDNLETFWKQVVVKKGLQQFEYVDLRYDKCVFAKSIQH